MKSNIVTINAIRFIILLLIQGLIFRRVTFDVGSFAYVHILIYPLFILLLPLKTPRALVVLSGFIMGIGVDLFYNSPGVHAATLVFTAYCRGLLLRILTPYEGYNVDDSPTLVTMGLGWYLSYAAAFFALHLFTYFSIEAFSFVYFIEILSNSLASFIATFLMVFIIDLIFRSKY